MGAVATKRQLWLSLDASEVGESLAAFDLKGLAKQTAEQPARLAPHHHAAAAEALRLYRLDMSQCLMVAHVSKQTRARADCRELGR